MFTLAYHYFVCFSTIDLFTLRVWLSLESNCMFSHLEFDHFVCLSLKMVTLYVWKKLSVPLWMFEIVNVYFVCLNYVFMIMHVICKLCKPLCVFYLFRLCVFFSSQSRGRTKPPHILLALANNNNDDMNNDDIRKLASKYMYNFDRLEWVQSWLWGEVETVVEIFWYVKIVRLLKILVCV